MKLSDQIKFLLLVSSFALLAIQVRAGKDEASDYDDEDFTGTGSDAEEPDGVEPQECSLEKFSALNKEMSDQGITDPDKMNSVQELFAKCKVFLKNELLRGVKRMTPAQRKLIKGFALESSADHGDYCGTIMALAKMFEEKTKQDFKKAQKDRELFERYFQAMIHFLIKPFDGPLLDLIKIYRIVFGPMDNESHAEAVAKKFSERTDPLTLEWATYAVNIQKLVKDKNERADELWFYFNEERKKNWGPMKVFRKVTGQ